MIPRTNLLSETAPQGIEVFQLTADSGFPSAHVYMEAQIFTPDSKHFLLHRHAGGHYTPNQDPNRQYYRCDIDDQCSLHQITEEPGVMAPAVSPDGQYVYYFLDDTSLGGGRLTLKRVRLDGRERDTVMTVETLPDTKYYPCRAYVLSTISADGERLAIQTLLADGSGAKPSSGLLIFDLKKATVEVIVLGESWFNTHAQYCRSTDPETVHDILVEENHGGSTDNDGQILKLVGGVGCDIHVIRDDGSNLRDMPWGRDGTEQCQGHQCWRGRSNWAITSTITALPNVENNERAESQLIEAQPVEHADHMGSRSPGARRNEITGHFPEPNFYHFGSDMAGTRLLSDYWRYHYDEQGGVSRIDQHLYLIKLDPPGSGPAASFNYLFDTRTGQASEMHAHPFLSPDGNMGFFNSSESGRCQAYMITGLNNI